MRFAPVPTRRPAGHASGDFCGPLSQVLDHVRPFVHRPDVVLRINTDTMGHLEVVEALTDLADEVAVLIELEQARVAAARDDEDGFEPIIRADNECTGL